MPFHRRFGRTPPPGPLVLARTPPLERPAALAAALGTSLTSVVALERRALDSGMDLSLLWSARPGGEEGVAGPPLASVLVIPHPGRTGLLLTGAPRDAAQARGLGTLIAHALEDLGTRRDVRLVQALLDPEDTLRATALRAGGMRHLATLEYLERPIHTLGGFGPARLPEGWSVAPWDPRERAMLCALLRRTYEETLDCPGLSDLRADEDILQGHLESGEHDPTLWFILRERGEPAGALLLSPSRASDSVEIVYLGLARHARGRGLARALLEHGLHAAASRRERVVSLAVDARNTPAARLYARLDFSPVRRREAWISPVPTARAAEGAPVAVK